MTNCTSTSDRKSSNWRANTSDSAEPARVSLLFFLSFCLLTLLTPRLALAQDLRAVFQYGRQMGLATVRQESLLVGYLSQWTPAQQQGLQQQIGRGRSPLAQFLLLESVLAFDQPAVIASFADRISPLSDQQLLAQCTVRTSQRSLIQQWQNSCSITVVEVFLADLCPRYAFELKAQPDFSTVSPAQPDGIAQQQLQLLRQYGGLGSLRGSSGGSDIGLNGPLNDFVGKILGVSFGAQAVGTDPVENVRLIRAQVAAGFCVPIRINIVPDVGHFLLILDSHLTATGPAFLMYEPYNGLMGYVSESNFRQNSLTPLNTTWQWQLTHLYSGQPTN